jgi:hypothetical protein
MAMSDTDDEAERFDDDEFIEYTVKAVNTCVGRPYALRGQMETLQELCEDISSIAQVAAEAGTLGLRVCDDNELAQLALVQAGAPAALVAAVHAAIRADHAGALEWACAAIGALVGNNPGVRAEAQPALVQAGAPAALVAAVHAATRAGRAGALERACTAICAIRGDSPEDDAEAEAALVQAGAPAALVAAVHTAIRAGRAGTLECACAAIQNLPTAALVQANAPAALVAAVNGAVVLVAAKDQAVRAGHATIMELKCTAGALRQACAAIGFLVGEGDNPEAEAALVQAGALSALIAAVNEAVDAGLRTVLDGACQATMAFTRNTETEAALLQAGAPVALVAAVHEGLRTRGVPSRDMALWNLCSFIGNLAGGDAETQAALVQAGAPKALVEVALQVGYRDDRDGAYQAIECLIRGTIETKAAMVQAGAHEILFSAGLPQDRLRRSLVAMAGPDATWTVGTDEPLRRVLYRIRVARVSFGVSDWAERHAGALSPAVKVFRGKKIELALLARACILANGDELAPGGPVGGWAGCAPHRDWHAIGDRLLESAERAVLEKLSLID